MGQPDLGDEDSRSICKRITGIERRLIETPSTTPDDVMAKLLLIAQLSEEGLEADDDFAALALADARRLGLAAPTQPWIAAA